MQQLIVFCPVILLKDRFPRSPAHHLSIAPHSPQDTLRAPLADRPQDALVRKDCKKLPLFLHGSLYHHCHPKEATSGFVPILHIPSACAKSPKIHAALHPKRLTKQQSEVYPIDWTAKP